MHNELIHVLEKQECNEPIGDKRYVSCLIITEQGQILLQKRGDDWSRYPGYISIFGGEINIGETPRDALVRELKEELGIDVPICEPMFLGLITEISSNHTELVYEYVWLEKGIMIENCYEGDIIRFNNHDEIMISLKLMDDVPWVINECQILGILTK